MREIAASGAATIGSVSNIYFWLDSGYFDVTNALKPLLHTWSLSVEEQFYILWPVVLATAVRYRVALPALVALFIGSLVAGFLFSHDPTAVFYLMPFRVYELALGGMLVWGVERIRLGQHLEELGLAVGLALIAIAAMTFTETTPFPINGLVPCVGAALVILTGTAPRVGLLLRNSVAVGIGLISYSVYLVHWPIIVFDRYVIHDAGGLEPNGLGGRRAGRAAGSRPGSRPRAQPTRRGPVPTSSTGRQRGHVASWRRPRQSRSCIIALWPAWVGDRVVLASRVGVRRPTSTFATSTVATRAILTGARPGAASP